MVIGGTMKKFLLALFAVCLLSAEGWAGSLEEAYKLNELCGKRAEEKFKNAYKIDEDRISSGINRYTDDSGFSISYTSHYSKTFDKCFIMIEESNSVFYSYEINDVNEGKHYGSYMLGGAAERCYVLKDPKLPDIGIGNIKHCKSESEFRTLVKPYMEE
jgi:hypothetical protein